MPQVPLDDLSRFAEAILTATGMPSATARQIAEHLIDSEGKGVTSHGISRIPRYVEQVEDGSVDPQARVTVPHEDGAWAEVNGGGGFGIPAAQRAVEVALRKARGTTVAVCGLVNCGHTGRVGRYVEQAAEHGFMAIMFGGGGGLNGYRQVAPHGGAKAIWGTNPYAFAMPGGHYGPIVVDFATAVAAQGKLAVHRTTGEALPPGWIIDADGRPSQHPEDFYQGGALLPAAGPKGSGLALIAELVGGALLGPPKDFNWMLFVLSAASLRTPADYAHAAEAILDSVKACPPQDGVEAVLLPGEMERARAAAVPASGLEIPQAIWDEVCEAAERLGVHEQPEARSSAAE